MRLDPVSAKFKPLLEYRIGSALENEYEARMSSALELDSRFMKMFFSQVISCGKMDCTELCVETSHRIRQIEIGVNGVGASWIQTELPLQDIYKWICAYNVLCFSRERLRTDAFDCSPNETDEFGENLFHIFEFTPDDVQIYIGLKRLSLNRAELDAKVALMLLEKLGGTEIHSKVLFAYIANLLYNAYLSFERSFPNYFSPTSSMFLVRA